MKRKTKSAAREATNGNGCVCFELTHPTAKAVSIALTDVMKNRAFASSPRTLEEFPEFARPAQPARATDTSLASTVIKNRAFASSPRAREEFPWLARGNYTVGETPFQVAPLK